MLRHFLQNDLFFSGKHAAGAREMSIQWPMRASLDLAERAQAYGCKRIKMPPFLRIFLHFPFEFSHAVSTEMFSIKHGINTRAQDIENSYQTQYKQRVRLRFIDMSMLKVSA